MSLVLWESKARSGVNSLPSSQWQSQISEFRLPAHLPALYPCCCASHSTWELFRRTNEQTKEWN